MEDVKSIEKTKSCARCKNHGLQTLLKSQHKNNCAYRYCICEKCSKTFEYNEKTRLKRLICREKENPTISKERIGKEPKPKKEKKPKSNHSIQSVPLENFPPEVQVTKSAENRGTVGTHQSLEQLVAQLRANQEKVLNAQKSQEVPNLNEPPQQLNIAKIQELSMKTPKILSSPMEGVHQKSPQAPVKSPKKKSRKPPPPSYDMSSQPMPNVSVSAQNSINDTTNQGTMNSLELSQIPQSSSGITHFSVPNFTTSMMNSFENPAWNGKIQIQAGKLSETCSSLPSISDQSGNLNTIPENPALINGTVSINSQNPTFSLNLNNDGATFLNSTNQANSFIQPQIQPTYNLMLSQNPSFSNIVVQPNSFSFSQVNLEIPCNINDSFPSLNPNSQNLQLNLNSVIEKSLNTLKSSNFQYIDFTQINPNQNFSPANLKPSFELSQPSLVEQMNNADNPTTQSFYYLFVPVDKNDSVNM